MTKPKGSWLMRAFALLLCAIGGRGIATAQIVFPTTAELYGVHELSVQRGYSGNPFNYFAVRFDVAYTAPDGRVIPFWGFFDGDGAGGMSGATWKARFMPDQEGTWSVRMSFSDLPQVPPYVEVRTFSVGQNPNPALRYPGPARLDPNNPKFLVDARGNPIHWRGYGIKHVQEDQLTGCCDPPLNAGDGQKFVTKYVNQHLVPKGYNAAYVMVPTGWKGQTHPLTGTCNPDATPSDCPLWGDYSRYSLRASKEFDTIIQALHQNRVWTISWITFALQNMPGGNAVFDALWNSNTPQGNYQRFMRYFTARYGAYYNFFMWSPTWEVFEQPDYVTRINTMMTYLQSIDPGYKDTGGTPRKRLHGAHDQAQTSWAAWQSILPRQQSSRRMTGLTAWFCDPNPPYYPIDCENRYSPSHPWEGTNSNTRQTGYYSGSNAGHYDYPNPENYMRQDYPNVIIGAEDLWEFASGKFNKPRNLTEVRRGLFGALFAGVLPMYDEWMLSDPPSGGAGASASQPVVQAVLSWWYGNVSYRHPQFMMMNWPNCSMAWSDVVWDAQQVCSGIPGQQYVLLHESGGTASISLSGVSGSFSVLQVSTVTGGMAWLADAQGGTLWSATVPADTLVILNKR